MKSGHLHCLPWIPQAKRIVQEQQAKEAAAVARREVRRAEEAEAKRIEAPILTFFAGEKGPKDVEQNRSVVDPVNKSFQVGFISYCLTKFNRLKSFNHIVHILADLCRLASLRGLRASRLGCSSPA